MSAADPALFPPSQRAVLDALRQCALTAEALRGVSPTWFADIHHLRALGYQIVEERDTELRTWTLVDDAEVL